MDCALSNGVIIMLFQLMIRGLCRKVLTFLLVGIAQVLDVHVLNQLGGASYRRDLLGDCQ